MNKAIVLLSGGLDSVVSLALAKSSCKELIALTFNYGQKSFKQEKKAAKKIADYYNIDTKIIDLPWLKKICDTKSLWIPNRNALFVNIAACYADALKFDTIILGVNKEEAETFKDNSINFVNSVNSSLKNSTNIEVQLYTPLVNMTKEEIVSKAVENEVPLELIYSCYSSKSKHCGKCESCTKLKKALSSNNKLDIIKKIF